MTTATLNTDTLPSLFLHKDARLDLVSDRPQPESLRGKAAARRILVIDDEINIADSLTEILASHGYEAVAFYEGQAAIDFASAECPACVISDVIMPEMNGIETVLAIQKLCPATRILLFSGQAGTADLLEAARTRGHDFEVLPKPIHPDQLLRRLSGLQN